MNFAPIHRLTVSRRLGLANVPRGMNSQRLHSSVHFSWETRPRSNIYPVVDLKVVINAT